MRTNTSGRSYSLGTTLRCSNAQSVPDPAHGYNAPLKNRTMVSGLLALKLKRSLWKALSSSEREAPKNCMCPFFTDRVSLMVTGSHMIRRLTTVWSYRVSSMIPRPWSKPPFVYYHFGRNDGRRQRDGQHRRTVVFVVGLTKALSAFILFTRTAP